MSADLTDAQNVVVGSVAAFIQAVSLQPTLYWKTASTNNLPFTLNPAVVYRGTGASIANEIAQMGAQVLVTGIAKRALSDSARDSVVGSSSATTMRVSPAAAISASMASGALTAVIGSPVELVMIQQQLCGTSFRQTLAAALASKTTPSPSPAELQSTPPAVRAPLLSSPAHSHSSIKSEPLHLRPSLASHYGHPRSAAACFAATHRVAAQSSACVRLISSRPWFGAAATPSSSVFAHLPHALAASPARFAILFRGLGPAMARDAGYVGGMLGVTPVVQEQLAAANLATASLANAPRSHLINAHGSNRVTPHKVGEEGTPGRAESIIASVIGGTIGSVCTHPFDVIKTRMQGDLTGERYGRTWLDVAVRVVKERGPAGLFAGCSWRTANIVISVFIINECFLRLGPHI